MISAFSACQGPPRFAGGKLSLTDEDAGPAQGILISSQRREALEAMRSIALAEDASEDPKPAGPRGRWASVPDAVFAAAEANEMAIFRTVHTRDSFEFVLRTIDNRRLVLTVERRDEPRVYEAKATAARRNTDDEIRDAVLRSFDEFMSRYGRKRSFGD